MSERRPAARRRERGRAESGGAAARRRRLGAVAALALLSTGAARAAEPAREFTLNGHMITAVRDGSAEQACDPKAVLRDLFAQIGPAASVYPTENYYYFQFHRAGRSYAGSLRLAADTRDAGVLEYACYPGYARWLAAEDEGLEIDLGAAEGVTVSRAGDLAYDVSFEGRTVRFRLNDLAQTPGARRLDGEAFAGRVFDESGLVFELIYNRPRKQFYFVLDVRDGVPERFVRVRDDVLVGKRTGFAFYRDAAADRLVLIAVEADEVHVNSHYDGPFDQLPENFYGQLGFWDLVLDAYPDLAGRLTPGGTYKGSDLIFAVSPYRFYGRDRSFRMVEPCLARSTDAVDRILCLIGEG